ncbi:MAG: type II secretion system F family protein [Candidatus Firestonebacteria bacterium]
MIKRIAIPFIIFLVLLLLLKNIVFSIIISVVIIFIVPRYLEARKSKEYLQKFEQELADGFDLIANSMRAGNAFVQAINVLTSETQGPLAKEFKTVLQENKLGMPLDESLLKMQERVKSEELNLAITAVLVTKESGGNIAEILKKISSTIRERQKLRARIDTLTAQGRLSGIVVGLLPFFLAFAIYLIDPGLISPMFNTTLGLILICIALIMELLGAFFIKKVVEIEI